MHAMLRRCFDLKMHNVGMQGRLFDALVVPVLNYGCEVWGPDYLSKLSTMQGGDEAELMHMAFIRQMLGVRKSTSKAAMMHETGRRPLCAAWLKQCLNFYNKIIARDPDDIVRQALMEDIQSTSVDSWSRHLSCCLQRVNCQSAIDAIMVGEEVDVEECVEELVDFQIAHFWKDLPDAPETPVRAQPDDARTGFKLLTYDRWFRTDDPILPFTKALVHRERITAVARFRMGSHALGVETGRWGVNVNGRRVMVERSKRLCLCCRLGERDDELHVLSCPSLEPLRKKHMGPYIDPKPQNIDDETINRIMNGQLADNLPRFWNKFALFLIDVESHRPKLEKSLRIQNLWAAMASRLLDGTCPEQ
jgi:hypothetical protein